MIAGTLQKLAPRRSVFLVMGILAVSAGRATAEPPPLEQLVGYFDSVALQDDNSMFGSQGTIPHVVSRWERPIMVHISGQLTDGLEQRLRWHLNRFRILAGVELRLVSRRDQANLRIALTTSADVTAHAGSADTLCLTQYGPSSGAIDYADIFIPVAEAVWLDNCMAHELMHAVGFFAHPKDNGNRSVLEQGAPPRVRTFTPMDAAGIRMLYDPRLRANLPRDRALPIARRIAAELLADWPEPSRMPRPGDSLDPDGFTSRDDGAVPPDNDNLAADPDRVAR